MANDYALELSPDLDPETAAELRRIRRQQDMADAMWQQSQQPLQGRMVGNVYVKSSPMEGIANLVKAYMAGQGRRTADEGYKAVGEKRKADEGVAWGKMTEAMTGKPEEVLPPDVYGPPQPAVQGSMENAARAGMESPYTRKAAQAITLEMIKQKVKAHDRVIVPAGGTVWEGGKAAYTAPFKPESGKMGTEDVHIGGGLWQSFKVGRNGEVDLQAPIGKPFAKRPTASDVSVSANAAVPKGDTKYAEKRMGDAAEAMTALTKSAESAYKSNQALTRFMEASKNGTQGGAQPIISATQNFISTFGYSPESLKDVRQMEQAMGDILGSKMAELGARGLTDRDMDVLRQSLPRVNTDRASRENVVNVLKKVNGNVISEWEAQRQQEIKTYPELSKRIPEPDWYRKHKQSTIRSFNSEEEAAAAGLESGTPVIINGVKGTWK